MNHKAMNQTLAKAVRVEYDADTDSVFLVFEIVDERFKQEVKKDWTKDVDVKVVGRNLVRDDIDMPKSI